MAKIKKVDNSKYLLPTKVRGAAAPNDKAALAKLLNQTRTNPFAGVPRNHTHLPAGATQEDFDNEVRAIQNTEMTKRDVAAQKEKEFERVVPFTAKEAASDLDFGPPPPVGRAPDPAANATKAS